MAGASARAVSSTGLVLMQREARREPSSATWPGGLSGLAATAGHGPLPARSSHSAASPGG